MINFKDYLTEGRDAPLYHGTGLIKLSMILQSNMIRAESDNNMGHEINGKLVMGVSLTRNLHFALAWARHKIAWEDDYKKIGCVLQLDQAKLIQNYKIVPYNHFKSYATRHKAWDGNVGLNIKNNPSKFPYGFATQMEEHVIGDIKNLQKYLTAIYVENKDETILKIDRNKAIDDQDKEHYISLIKEFQ